MASKKAPSPAMEFLLASLKEDKKAVYADLKAKADEKMLKVFPIMFGRAQAILGIVKSAKRGQGKAKMAAKAKATKAVGGAAPAKRGPGRPSGSGSSKSGQVRELLATGMSAGGIAKKVGCTTALVYNVKSASGQKRMAKKRGVGRPGKSSASTNLNGLDGILAAVKNSERERARMLAALERVQAVIADALR